MFRTDGFPCTLKKQRFESSIRWQNIKQLCAVRISRQPKPPNSGIDPPSRPWRLQCSQSLKELTPAKGGATPLGRGKTKRTHKPWVYLCAPFKLTHSNEAPSEKKGNPYLIEKAAKRICAGKNICQTPTALGPGRLLRLRLPSIQPTR